MHKNDGIVLMQKLREIIQRQKVISAKDAAALVGSRSMIYRLVQKGELKQVYPKGMGFYTLPDITEGEAQFGILPKYFPQCVVSGKTALSLYGLGDDYISEIDVDIPNTTNISNPLFKVHRVHARKIFEIEERLFNNHKVLIKIYSPERSLYEAFKYGDRSEIYLKAIKRYRKIYLNKKKPATQYEKIREIDEKLRVRILRDLVMEDIHD